MGKITALKDKWVKIGDQLINLNSFSNVQKGRFGILESDNAYYIEVTDINKNEDGSYNKYMITTYKDDEEKLWEEDFETIVAPLKS